MRQDTPQPYRILPALGGIRLSELPLGLQLTAGEYEIDRWTVGDRDIWLTNRRLILDAGRAHTAVLRLTHITSVEVTRTHDTGMRRLGGWLLALGILVLAFSLFYGSRDPYTSNQITSIAGLASFVFAVVGAALLLMAGSTALFVTSTSGEEYRLAGDSRAQRRTVDSLVAELGDALALNEGAASDMEPGPRPLAPA